MPKFAKLLLGLGLVAGSIPPSAAIERTEHDFVLDLEGDGYATVPADPAFDLPVEFTIEAWVKRDNDINCETIVSQGFQASWWLGFCNQTIRFYGAGSGTLKDGNTPIPANVWTHVAVVYRSGGGRIYYINGEMDLFDAAPDPVPTATTAPVWIGRDPGGCCSFEGRIASVRIWDYARTQDQIRRNLHTDFDGPRPGLIANWRLNADYEDNAGGHDAASSGGAGFDLDADRPGQPQVIPVDPNFSTLPFSLWGAASVYLPAPNEVLIIGGNRGGSDAKEVVAVDAATGGVRSAVATLPTSLSGAEAVRVPGSGRVYIFGGITSSGYTDSIHVLEPSTGTVQALSVALPQPRAFLAGVWHEASQRVLLFGGTDGGSGSSTDQIVAFDPVTESIEVAAESLPTPLFGLDAVASSIDQRIYLFGGEVPSTGRSDAIIAVGMRDDGTLMLQTLTSRIHRGQFLPGAVEDPHTGLIYLAGAADDPWVSVFDPAAGQVWRTRLALPRTRDRASVAYSPVNRQLLVIGGDRFASLRNVWRIPLADGPPVPAGDWDFPAGAISGITSIAGEGRGVAIGTLDRGAYRYRDSLSTRSWYSPTNLGSASGQVNDVAYQSSNDYVWIATEDAGARLRGITTSQNYNSSLLGTSRVLSIARNPAISGLAQQPWFGTAARGSLSQRFQFSVSGGTLVWRRNFDGDNVDAIDFRVGEDAWLISNSRLKQVIPGSFFDTEADFGLPCGRSGARDLILAPNGDWWVATDAVEFGAALCRIPAAPTPGSGSTFCPGIGCRGRALDVDAEARVWSALESDSVSSGGLVAYEVPGGSDGIVRTSEFNWLNAPLGRLESLEVSPDERLWASGLTAVGAVEEKVWVGNREGRLATLTQRWRRLEEAGDLRLHDIDHVWLERGHAFLAGPGNLHVLLPDGRTWRTHFGVSVHDVAADGQGRIWLATDAGIRIYRPDGSFDDLSGVEGEAPAGPVRAVAVDAESRVWIGGDNGLTLFDRERFVLTWTTTVSALPSDRVRTLLIDSDNLLWIGTDEGLAKLEDNRFTVFTSADGLPGDIVDDLAQLGSGEIAISQPGASVSLLDGTSVSSLPDPPTPQPVPLSSDEDGRLWAGRSLWLDGQWRSFHPTNSGMIQSEVSDVEADRAGRVWFAHGSFGGVAVRSAHLPSLANVVPLVSDVTPLSGRAGRLVTITGSGFGRTVADVEVMIGAASAQVVSVTPTEIRVRLGEHNTSGEVTVRIAGRQVSAPETFCAVPSIDRFTPTGSNVGSEIRIFGANFDPNLELTVGDGSARRVSASPTELRTRLLPDDGSGLLQVRNLHSGCNQTTTSTLSFRRMEVSIERLVLNQGHPGADLVTNRPTIVQHYLRSDRLPRFGDDYDDVLSIDRVEIELSAAGSTPQLIRRDYNGPEPVWPLPAGPYPNALLRDLDNSLNVSVRPSSIFVPGSLDEADTVSVRSRLYNGSQLVAEVTADRHFRPDQTLGVLLVPVLRNDWTPAVLNDVRDRVNANLEDARERLLPFGRIRFLWSPTVFTADDVLLGGNTRIDIGNILDLYDASHELDRARRAWNGTRTPDVIVAMGVVDSSINSNDSVAGLAMWPDVSALINSLGLSAVDQLCEIGDAVVNFFTFGLVGGDGCDIEIPLYVTWAEDSDDASQLFTHELGHVLGLVRAPSANYDGGNISHSRTDEIVGGTCGDAIDQTGSYSRDLTLYRAPGIQLPLVNPLTGQQFLPRLGDEATWDVDGAGTLVTSGAFTNRAKALMSYACADGNRNVFFEPADNAVMSITLALDGLGRSDGITPVDVVGPRIYVSGTVDRVGGSGQLENVQRLADDAPMDASFVSDWQLVQLDDNGMELQRRGIVPVFSFSAHADGSNRATESDTGFFAATLLAEPDLARLELRRGDQVLDALEAGPGVPSVTLSSPSGGSYSSGDVNVAWTATDPDGDALAVTVYYSADNGTSWTPVAYSNGSGSVGLPVVTLAGAAQARVRVEASDGFHVGSADSGAFSVAAQAPSAWIGAPDNQATYLEWERVPLSGGASDNADLEVPDTGLSWTSDRDGLLGAGGDIAPRLSVGTHVITLTAVNSAGLVDTAQITVIVRGDYDADGIADDEELNRGLNPLRSADAYLDSDGDGLPDRMERAWGTDPLDPDTSGSGRTDAEDIGDGLDPLDPADSLPADSLQVTPVDIELFADMGAGTLLPRANLQVLSREPVSWVVSSDRDWLVPYPNAGTTPDAVSLRAQADALGDGTFSGALTFSSSLGDVVVPVTLEVDNSADDPLRFIFSDSFDAPP